MIRLRDLLMERLKYGITIVKRIATALGETVTEELGKGVNGIAYATESGRVFKITADAAEVALATRLRTKRLYKHIVNVYDVRKLPESYNKEWGGTLPSYVIIQDRVEPIEENHRNIWNQIRPEYLNTAISDSEFRKIVPKLIENSSKTTPDDSFIDRIMPQRLSVSRDFSELRIDVSEAHGNNMGWNRHGNLVHFDAHQHEHYTKVHPVVWEKYKLHNYLRPVNRTPYDKGVGPEPEV